MGIKMDSVSNKNESFRGYFKNDKMNGFGKLKNENAEFYGYWKNDIILI